MKLVFSILASAMDGGAGAVAATCSGRDAMTRCECAELPFDEIARRLRDGATLEEVQERTGCGRLCTACLPDLRAHLARRR
jgi:bacterioferritin-associated ferredoxin